MTQTFGDRVRLARERVGVSQATLARQLGVSKGTMSMIETGKRRDKGVERLRELAQALHVSANYLAGLEENPCAESEAQ